MKKHLLLALITIMALAIVALGGCGSQEATTEDSTPPEQEAVTNEEYQRLSDTDAAALASKGYEIYVHVARGGDTGNDAAPRQTIDGMDYRPLGSDIDTEEKLMEYMGQAFTGEAIFYYMESAGIKTVEGKLYQPDADGGSILDWNQATATLYIDDISAAQFDVKVPSDAEEAPELTTIRINYAVEGDTWKVASNPAEIY